MTFNHRITGPVNAHLIAELGINTIRNFKQFYLAAKQIKVNPGSSIIKTLETLSPRWSSFKIIGLLVPKKMIFMDFGHI